MNVMKRLFFVLIIASAGLLYAQPQYHDCDTLDRLPHRYYTPEWYADCPIFLTDTHVFSSPIHFIYGSQHPYVTRKQYVNEYSVNGQMEIKGMMCLVEAQLPPLGNFVVSNTVRAPEWLTLLQGGAMYPATGNFFPRDMAIVDSLRWDTVLPYLVRLPRFAGAIADSDHFLFYAYEVYFPTPVVVDSVFYIAGTLRSNTYNEEIIDNYTSRKVLEYYPTVYGCIAPVTNGNNDCDFCTTRNNRMFAADDGLVHDREDWYITWYPYSYYHDRFRQITGPIFAIVDLHSLTVNSSNPDAGTVSGGGNYPHLSNATIEATPAPGCSFVRWNDGSTENPRIIQMTADVRLVAIFR